MNPLLKNILRRALFWEANRKRVAFERAAKNYRQAQEEVLLKKLRRTASSLFGQRHGFGGIRNIADFRAQVPLSTYEEMAPYLEKVRRGDVTALFPKGEKIHMFALSSGTTNKPKAIPVTTPFLKEYKRGSLIWGMHAALKHEAFVDGKILMIVSPACEERTENGIPCGAISGMIAQSQKYFARSLYPVPGAVFGVSDADLRDYLILRFSFSEKVTFLTTANPSTLLRLARSADRYRERLLKDLHDGTLTPPAGNFPPLPERLKPQPALARKLEKTAGGRPFSPRLFWPDLALIGCWKGGTLSSYLPTVRELYGNAPIRDLGLLASEGRMTIPIEDDGAAGVLDMQSHFFEFLPEEEPFRPNAPTLLGDELEIGKKYFILPTTSSGLYRYHIHDLVQVEGFFHKAPVLKFLNKGNFFSSITGEKISEHQVVQAVNSAAAEHRLVLERFVLTPQWGEPPHYRLLVENNSTVAAGAWASFSSSVERHLQTMNVEYQSKRQSNRLGAVELEFHPSGTFRKWDKMQQAAMKGRHEQFKPRFLSNDLSFLKEFAIK